jgi:tetratricopeptide (TPR) repeat protein
MVRQAMAVLTAEHRHANFGMVSLPYMTTRGYVALCQAELGGFTEGSGVGQDAVRIAEEVGQPFSLAGALIFAGVLSRRQGDVHKAIPMLERGLALCQTANILRLFPMAASVLGAAYALTGRAAEALPLLDQTLERVAPGRRVIFQALVLTELSEALCLVGRMEEAHVLAGRLLEHSRTHIGRGYQAHGYRLLGEVAMHRDSLDMELAEAHYCRALVLADELGMRPLLAHCHYGLGILYTQRGRPEQACAELSVAIELYRAMEMAFWLQRAEAALEQVT